MKGGNKLNTFAEFLGQIESQNQRTRMEEVLGWVTDKYPKLGHKIGWNQPMFTDHGTFIIGFSVTKKHLNVAPEKVVVDHFSDEIVQAGYEHTKELIQMPWDLPIDYNLLEKIIEFNILEKAGMTAFWRKRE